MTANIRTSTNTDHPEARPRLGALIRARDWSGSTLGAREAWPGPLEGALALLLAAPHPAWLAWGKERVLFYNDACIPLLGERHPRALGADARDVWAEHRAALDDVLELAKSGKPCAVVQQVHAGAARARGAVQWVAALTPLPGLEGVSCHYREESLSKPARELVESEEMFRTLVEQVRDHAIFRTDNEGRPSTWNVGVERVLGFAEREFIGADITSIIFTPEDIARGVPRAELEHAAECGSAHNDRWMRKKDGTLFFAMGATTRLLDGDRLVGFTKVMRDQTAVKRAADRMRFLGDASAALVELLDYDAVLERIANLAVGGFADFCVVDVLDANGTRRRISATRPESTATLAAKETDLRWPPAPSDEHGIGFVLRTGQPELVPEVTDAHLRSLAQSEEHLTALRARGVQSYVCVPLVSRGTVMGGLTFVTTVRGCSYGEDDLRAIRDLAARIGAAIDNARLYEALKNADRHKDEFLATLAHELRNPLAPLRTGLQLLEASDDQSPATRRVREMMARQLTHMVRLIDDLLDISRVSRGRIELRRERVLVQSVVERALESSLPFIDAAGHELSAKLPEAPLYIDADPVRIAQVVSNIIHNAAKYTPGSGRLSLRVAADDGQVVISVSDNGVGIAREMLPRVFELFAQIGGSLERAQGGLGIGLSLAKRLVEMHGGSITAESAGLGQGSTFSVRLPLAAPAAASSAPAPERVEPRAPSTTLHILVVDDNVDGAETLAMLLDLLGHTTDIAHDGPRALAAARGRRPDLIVLDIGLPGMSGYDVAREIRADARLRDVVLVALTGWGSVEDKQRSARAGFNFHLTKPVDADNLRQVLADAVTARRPSAVR